MNGLLSLSNLAAWWAQVAFIVTAALLALWLVRLSAPSIRYTFLRIVLAVCLMLPFIQPRVPASIAPEGRATSASAATVAGDHSAAPSQTAGLNPRVPWLAVLTVLVATGTLARLLWIGAGILRLRRLRRIGELAPDDAEHQELQSIIDTRATIRYVRGLGQPVTFGYRHPVVLLPSSLSTWSAGIRRAVLAHELWHVRRRDWIWTLGEETVRAVLWFHPAIWALLSRIQSAREEVVDELTILTTGSRRSYFNALLAYANEPPLFAATAFARRTHLVNRLVLISKEAVMSGKRVVTCCAVLALVMVSAGWYAVQAFPLMQAQPPAETLAVDPGPVELRAKPITPENPIPRRTRYVEPEYPADLEAAGVTGKVTVRLTLDETGHIAETRVVGFSLKTGSSGSVQYYQDTHRRWMGTGQGTGSAWGGTGSAAFLNLARSAITAVNQWQYDAPADGPITFNSDVWFGVPPPPPPPPPAPRDGALRQGPPPPPPPPPPPGSDTLPSSADPLLDGALRIGGSIRAPVKLRHVNPVYPAEAQVNKVQGIVIIEARIDRDGTVTDARILRSVPPLDDAALEAVRQWEFTPTLLNGEPVPVVMTVTVNFTLQ